MEELAKHFGILTPYFYAVGTYGFFRWLDNNASDEAKATLAGLVKITEYDQTDVAAALIEVFDRLYARPLFSWRAFRRSMFITILISIIYYYELAAIYPRTHYDPGQYRVTPILFYSTMFVILASNILSDYLSLFLIRWWLFFSGNRPFSALVLGSSIGVVAVFAGWVIRGFLLIILVAYQTGSSLNNLLRIVVQTLYSVVVTHHTESGLMLGLPAAIVFVWLPLFAIGICVLRVAKPVRWAIVRAQRFLKGGKEHPLDAIGYIAALVVLVGSLAFQCLFRKGGA